MAESSIVLETDRIAVCHGDCLDVLRQLPDETIDSVVCDPPYALNMSDWDADHPNPQVWRECVRVLRPGSYLLSFGGTRTWHRLACDIEDAGFEIQDSIAWLYSQGFAKPHRLKPAFEPIIVAHKSGRGDLQVGDCRLGSGRWPPNVTLDEDVADELDAQTATLKPGGSIGPYSKGAGPRRNAIYGIDARDRGPWQSYGDSGGASRFFYCAKASAKERPAVNGVVHKTVKPLALIRHLVKLACPQGGTVLDPFAGSGTTGEAALVEGMNCVLIERETDYIPLILARIDRHEENSA